MFVIVLFENIIEVHLAEISKQFLSAPDQESKKELAIVKLPED